MLRDKGGPFRPDDEGFEPYFLELEELVELAFLLSSLLLLELEEL
jgi:hypothetical protein